MHVFELYYKQSLFPFYYNDIRVRSIIAETKEQAIDILKRIEGDRSYCGGTLDIEIENR